MWLQPHNTANKTFVMAQTANGAPFWKDPQTGFKVESAGYADQATSAATSTNIAGGSQGTVLYQSGVGTTTSLTKPTTLNKKFVLSQVNGDTVGTVPTWTDASTLSAAGLAGGSANNLVYQSSPNTTTFLPNPTTNSILSFNTTSGLGWTGTTRFPIGNLTLFEENGALCRQLGPMKNCWQTPFDKIMLAVDKTATFTADAKNNWTILSSPGVAYSLRCIAGSLGIYTGTPLSLTNIYKSATGWGSAFTISSVASAVFTLAILSTLQVQIKNSAGTAVWTSTSTVPATAVAIAMLDGPYFPAGTTGSSPLVYQDASGASVGLFY
jgi:hypothetical protein